MVFIKHMRENKSNNHKTKKKDPRKYKRYEYGKQ